MTDHNIPWHHLRLPAGSTKLFTGIVGSHSHGTNIPPTDPMGTDDVDVVAIVLPPPALSLGIDSWDHTQQWANEFDITCYSLQKFIGLLAKSNPNVLSLLFLPDDCRISESPEWDHLIRNRGLFLTKEAYNSFAGYANGQLKRMTHSAYNGYMGDRRKAIVDEIGYDTKNAAHLIRLLRMGIEFLTEGELYVKRQDATQLLEIKHGEWTLDKVKAEADKLFALAEESYVRSSLPNDTNTDAVNCLLVSILENRFGSRP